MLIPYPKFVLIIYFFSIQLFQLLNDLKPSTSLELYKYDFMLSISFNKLLKLSFNKYSHISSTFRISSVFTI